MGKRFLIWFWSGGGGGSTFALNLALRLKLQFGAGSVRLSLRADDPVLPRAEAAGLDVCAADIVSDRRKPLATLAALTQSRSVLAEHAVGADAVIVPMNFAAAAPLCASLKQPLIYCAHDPEPHPGDYARMLQRATQTLLLSRAARVVALSNYAGELLKKQGVGDTLVVAPLGSVFEPREKPARREGPLRLLFAGRMIAYKGGDLLAEALKHIAGRDDWRLTVAGFGPALDAEAAKQFEFRQVERVERGWLSDDALDALIADADLVLAPYRSATQSGIVAEAVACGTPCIVTRVGALPEQIGAGAAGWIADAVTPDAYAAALTRALGRHEERAEKASAAKALAEGLWHSDSWGWLERL